MKNKFYLGIFIILLLLFVTDCANDKNSFNKIDDNSNQELEENREVSEDKMLNINVNINGRIYIAQMEDNNTSKEFINMLPLELNMNDLNNNEKYYYLDSPLSTNPYNPKKIESGDIMLYGNNCLVVFYKSFATSYNYTKIGHIDNMPNLDGDSTIIKFEN